MINIPQPGFDNLRDPAFLKTVDDFINGRLANDAAHELREQLIKDDAATLVYVEYMDLHAELIRFTATYLEEGSFASGSAWNSLIDTEEFTKRKKFRPGHLAGMALAIAALLMLSGFLFPWRQPLLQARSDLKQPIGRCVMSGAVVWAETFPGHLDEIRSGERLHALQGRFELHLNSGVTAACVAPVDVEIVSPDEIFVHQGELCVHVPQNAIGFRANTAAMEIVDLGTVFGVRVKNDRSAEMHVFEGRVKIRQGKSAFKEISAGLTVTANEKESAFSMTSTAPEGFRSSFASLTGISETTGGMQVLSTPPESVRKNQLVTESTACLLLERSNVPVSSELILAAARPGLYDAKHPPELVRISPGTVVTSYFINAQNSASTPAEGTVMFDRPILGLALTGSQLDLTDLQFGHPAVRYPRTGEQAASRGTVFGESADEVEIFPDGKTLRVRMGCSAGSFDQIRVFVADHP